MLLPRACVMPACWDVPVGAGEKRTPADAPSCACCRGGEFKPAVRWLAPQYPSVNFLISSSLWNNLTSWGMPNVRAITGRISGEEGGRTEEGGYAARMR